MPLTAVQTSDITYQMTDASEPPTCQHVSKALVVQLNFHILEHHAKRLGVAHTGFRQMENDAFLKASNHQKAPFACPRAQTQFF